MGSITDALKAYGFDAVEVPKTRKAPSPATPGEDAMGMLGDDWRIKRREEADEWFHRVVRNYRRLPPGLISDLRLCEKERNALDLRYLANNGRVREASIFYPEVARIFYKPHLIVMRGSYEDSQLVEVCLDSIVSLELSSGDMKGVRWFRDNQGMLVRQRPEDIRNCGRR